VDVSQFGLAIAFHVGFDLTRGFSAFRIAARIPLLVHDGKGNAGPGIAVRQIGFGHPQGDVGFHVGARYLIERTPRGDLGFLAFGSFRPNDHNVQMDHLAGHFRQEFGRVLLLLVLCW